MTPAEKRLLRAVTNYSRFNASRSLGVEADSEFASTKFGAAIALTDPARPRLPMFNRVLGLSPTDAKQIDAILRHYKSAGCEPHFELSPDAIVPDLIGDLVGHGFEPSDAISYMVTAPGAQAPKLAAADKPTISRWQADDADRFRELLGRSGVTCEDSVWERRRQHYCSETFRVFVAEIEGEPCSWATLYADDDSRAAYLANAYTIPEFRGRRCHLALLEARLADARDLGLRAAYTDAIPDTPSARNCRRAGFSPSTTLTLWHR